MWLGWGAMACSRLRDAGRTPLQAIVPSDADTAERLSAASTPTTPSCRGGAPAGGRSTDQARQRLWTRPTGPTPAPSSPTSFPPGGTGPPPVGLFGHRVAAPDRLAGLAGREVGGRRPGSRGHGSAGPAGRWRWPERWPPVRWGCGQPAESPFSRELGSLRGPGAGEVGFSHARVGTLWVGRVRAGGGCDWVAAAGMARSGSAPGTTPVCNRPPVPTSTRDPATARHTGGVTSRGGSLPRVQHHARRRSPSPRQRSNRPGQVAQARRRLSGPGPSPARPRRPTPGGALSTRDHNRAPAGTGGSAAEQPGAKDRAELRFAYHRIRRRARGHWVRFSIDRRWATLVVAVMLGAGGGS